MAGFNGRELTIDWSSVTLVGVRTRGLSMSNDYVDVTSDDDAGYRKLLSDPGVRSCEVSVSGISSDEVLLAAISAASVSSETLAVNLPSSLSSPGDVTGSFLISSFEINGEHDGAVEFSATFMSDGAFTYTASSGA